MPEAQRIKTKVCLIGEAAVGKTSLIRRFVQDEFDDRYITTLGAKVSKREMTFETRDRTKIDMDMTVWDIMGEKGFRDLLKEAFFHGAKGVVAVCDLTRYSTLKELDDWVQSVFNVVGEIPVVYAVNKIDLKDEVMILYGDKEIAQAVRAFEAPYFYASAKMGEKGCRELLKDAYFYGANGILAVADLTRRRTLDNLDDWIDGVEDVVGKVPILIAVNKSDLAANARFREIDVAAFAKAYHAEFFMTSAKTGERVEDAFRRLGVLVAEQQLQLA